MKLYSCAFYAQKGDGFVIAATYINATSKNEALGWALTQAHNQYPRGAGYTNHTVVVAEVDKSMLDYMRAINEHRNS